MKRKSVRVNNSNLSHLDTEQPNSASRGLETKSSLEIARLINSEDEKVALAVREALPKIAEAIDAIYDSLRRGGRLIYVGAGTSGRIAALDCAELPPTFNVNPRSVLFVMAGGTKALAAATEGEEDSPSIGEHAMAKKIPDKRDVVVGIAASGRTPFTVAAVRYAKKKGARTVAVTCNRNSPLGKAGDIEIVTEVGHEVISGSTRMKAGTAQKLVLNTISSGAMARLGYVYDGLMVNLHLRNVKLFERGLSILQQAAQISRDQAQRALKSSGNSVPVALVMLKTGADRKTSERALKEHGGHVRNAITGFRSL